MVQADEDEVDYVERKSRRREKDVEKGKGAELGRDFDLFPFELSFLSSPSTFHLALPPENQRRHPRMFSSTTGTPRRRPARKAGATGSPSPAPPSFNGALSPSSSSPASPLSFAQSLQPPSTQQRTSSSLRVVQYAGSVDGGDSQMDGGASDFGGATTQTRGDGRDSKVWVRDNRHEVFEQGGLPAEVEEVLKSAGEFQFLLLELKDSP